GRSKGHRLECRLRFANGGRAKRQSRLRLVALARGPQDRCSDLLTRRAALALFVERVAEPADDQPTDRSRIAEADFGLCRVDVDVDLLERDVEEQSRDRMTVARD